MKEIKYQIKYINKLANTAKELLTDGYTVIVALSYLKLQQDLVKHIWFRKL